MNCKLSLLYLVFDENAQQKSDSALGNNELKYKNNFKLSDFD